MAKAEESEVHLLMFPLLAPGHLIPLLDLTRRLLTQFPNRLTVTFIIDPSSLSLLRPLIQSFPPPAFHPLILSLPPPGPGSGYISRIRSLRALSDPITSWFQSHPSPPHALIADMLLGWTHSLCSHLGLPRVLFSPSGAFGYSVLNSMWRDAPSNSLGHAGLEVRFDDIPGSPRFKWYQLSTLFCSSKMGDPHWEAFRQDMAMNLACWGAIFNSFSDLEPAYLDHLRKEMGHDRVWAVGPLSPDGDAAPDLVAQRGGPSAVSAQKVLMWLDAKPDCSVVYVCFGSNASLTRPALAALGAALECSKVHFIWCVRESEGGQGMRMPDLKYEDRMAERGLVIRGWAPQLAILRHKAVAAFLTHCGWNSMLESVSSGVMMLAWPLGADQYSNAQLIVGQLGLGLYVPRHGVDDVPDQGELTQLLADSVSPDRVERTRVMRLREAAATAVSGGSSIADLDSFVMSLDKTKK